MTELTYIDLEPEGGAVVTVPLNDEIVISIQVKYNYSIECWVMDIYDAQDEPLAMGIMLVPEIDLLKGMPALKDEIGTFVLIEKTQGAYKDVSSLGVTTKLLWFAPGAEIEY